MVVDSAIDSANQRIHSMPARHNLLNCMLLTLIVISVAGCFGGATTIASLERGDTLASLPLLPDPANVAPAEIDLSSVIEGYRRALEVIDQPTRREDIMRRLALLELRVAEDRQIQQADVAATALYGDAIARYRALLTEQASRSDNDQLLYPLAKAYDLSGQPERALATFTQLVDEFPQSVFFSESQFRRGEILFASQRYAAAENAYRAVVERDEETPFLENAYYMQAWSQFKLGDYYSSTITFTEVLDRLGVGGDMAINKGSAAEHSNVENSTPEQNISEKPSLDQDVFRAIVLALAYQDGPASLNSVLDDIGERVYAPLLFDRLGRHYLAQRRFRDSAQSFAAFAERYPLNENSPLFKQHEIDAYLTGGFPHDARDKKKEFVRDYAVAGEYWENTTSERRKSLMPKLDSYIIELASYYHAKAQQLDKSGKQGEALSGSKTLDPNGAKPIALNHYREASSWYREWLRSFSNDDRRIGYWRLLAETLLPQQQLDSAVFAFEQSAYEVVEFSSGEPLPISTDGTVDPLLSLDQDAMLVAQYIASEPLSRQKQRADSAYSGWAISAELIDDETHRIALAKNRVASDQDTSAIDSLNKLRYQRVASAHRFYSTFPFDRRSFAVEAASINELLALDEYHAVIAASDHLLARIEQQANSNKQDHVADKSLRETAWLSSAHASLALLDYADAERRYARAVDLLSVPSIGLNEKSARARVELLAQTVDNLAASIYKQGEQLSDSGRLSGAAAKLMQVVTVAPSSSLVSTAIYDAGMLFYKAQAWKDAISTMEQFQSRYPNDSRLVNFPPRLLEAKKAIGDYVGAAEQAMLIYHHHRDQAKATSKQQKLSSKVESGALPSDDDRELSRQALFAAAELYQQASVVDKAAVNRAIVAYRQYAHEFTQPVAERMEAMYTLTQLYLDEKLMDKREYWLTKIIASHRDMSEKTQRSTYLAAFSSAELLSAKLPDYYAMRLTAPLQQSLAAKRKALEQRLAECEELAAYAVAEFTTLATQHMGQLYADFASSLLASERPRDLDDLALEQYDILLEEQAYPFEEKAIEFHKANVARAWQGLRTPAIRTSFEALKTLLPAQFDKPEIKPSL